MSTRRPPDGDQYLYRPVGRGWARIVAAFVDSCDQKKPLNSVAYAPIEALCIERRRRRVRHVAPTRVLNATRLIFPSQLHHIRSDEHHT